MWKATVELYLDVQSEAEACDAVAEMLRPMLRHYDPSSCLVDWNHARQYGTPSPTPASDDEIAALEYQIGPGIAISTDRTKCCSWKKTAL